jgi:acetamidase/formamidase
MPGDVLAVHFASIEPGCALGFSTTAPLFGALTAYVAGTDRERR